MKRLLASSLLISQLVSCAPDSTRRALDSIARTNDPARLELSTGFNSYVQCTLLADRTETGIISLADGSSARYWFRSHHLSNGNGMLLRMSDGREMYMRGYHCCEVQLPEEQLASLKELRAFVAAHDGEPP